MTRSGRDGASGDEPVDFAVRPVVGDDDDAPGRSMHPGMDLLPVLGCRIVR